MGGAMEQLRIDASGSMSDGAGNSAIGLTGEAELYVESAAHAAIPPELFKLGQLEVLYEADCKVLWSYMRPTGRPSFNRQMLGDFVNWQQLIEAGFGPDKVPLKFLVLGSRAPGVFCFGGDLDLFRRLIEARDRDGLIAYGHRCCQILHRNVNSLGLPIVTIGMVQGDALGGGFEALLSFDYVIAERSATFGLPEMMFGLFPGMGAHSLLSRKLGSAIADRLIVSNETYSAQQMYDLGIVHQIAEDGEGLAATRDFIRKSTRKHAGLVNSRRAMKICWDLELEELTRITELWADAALQLGEKDLKLMNRLVSAQTKLVGAA